MRRVLIDGCLPAVLLVFAVSGFASSINAPVVELDSIHKANAPAIATVPPDYSWTTLVPFGSEDDESGSEALNPNDAAALDVLVQQVTNRGGKVFLVSGNAFGVRGARGVHVLGSVDGPGNAVSGSAGDALGSGAVPEPASWMLSGAGLALLIRAYYSKNRGSISPK